MRALVTGAAGFIGSRLVRRLLDQPDMAVVGVDAFTDYYSESQKLKNIQGLPEGRFTLIRGDLNSLPLSEILAGIDVVYHQAAQAGVRSSWGAEFSTYTSNNVLATQRLLEACRRAAVHKFVYASSSSIYGEALRFPVTETDLPKPFSPYGVTKLAGEHLAGLYAANFGVPTVSLRYFTVYGEGQRPDMAFHKFIRAALRGEPINVHGNGSQIRDFTYVEDVVQANLLAGQSDLPPGAVFNVSGGSNVSVNEVIELIGSLLDTPLEVAFGPPVPGDVRRTGGESHTFRQATGWNPVTTLTDGIAAEIQWIKSM